MQFVPNNCQTHRAQDYLPVIRQTQHIGIDWPSKEEAELVLLQGLPQTKTLSHVWTHCPSLSHLTLISLFSIGHRISEGQCFDLYENWKTFPLRTELRMSVHKLAQNTHLPYKNGSCQSFTKNLYFLILCSSFLSGELRPNPKNLIIGVMDDMQRKQAYLRQQILDRQYDPQQFIEFLDSKLNIGDDLTLCTYEQLKSVVEIFLCLHEQDNEPQTQPEQPKTEVLIKTQSIVSNKTSAPSAIKPKTILFDKSNFTEPEFVKTFKCVKIHEKWQGKEIHCRVSNPQRKSIGGFFGIGATSFLEFEVSTMEMQWVVGRRYSDFQWLRNYLRNKYPTQIVPPIPEKKAAKRTQRHVQKRMRILEYFLNDLMAVPEFRNNRYVEGFLKVTEPSKFAKLKQDSEKQGKQEGVSQVQTQNGEVEVKFNAENRAYLQEMKAFVPQIQRLYKSLTRQGKELQNLQLQQVNTMYQMGNLCAELHQKSREVLNRIPKADGLRKLNHTFVTLNNMLIEWGNLLRGQFGIIEKNFNTFFKYVRNDLHGYLQIFTQQDILEEEFAKTRIALDKKKEKVYALFDVSKWELSKEIASSLPKDIVHDKAEAFRVMLPRQNSELQKARIKNCLYMSQLYKNGDDNFKRSSQKFQENFKEWSIKIKVNTQQIQQLWNQMSASFSGANKPQQLKEKPVNQSTGDEILDD